MHVSAHLYEGTDDRIIVQPSSTLLFIEEGPLSQAQSSLIQLVQSQLALGFPFLLLSSRNYKL